MPIINLTSLMMPHCVYKSLTMIGYKTVNVIDASLCVQMPRDDRLCDGKFG
jgi:hypothetical protein